MQDDEALREALIELKALREREAAALRESTALVDALGCLADPGRPAEAATRLLETVRHSLGADVALLLAPVGRHAEIRGATRAELAGRGFPAGPVAAGRPLRVVETAALDWWDGTPAALKAARALLSAPLPLPEGTTGALLCLSETPARFSADDARLLERLATVAAQGLATLSLAERNALLAGVIDGSSSSVAIADARREDLPLVYVNDAFLALTGCGREEVLGRNCRFLAAEPPGAPVRARLRETVASRGQGCFELRNRRKDGQVFWNRLTLFPVADADGRPRHLVATQTDITAEREAAEARDLAQRRLTSALSATSEGFLLLDPDGAVVFANDRFRDFFEAPGAPLAAGADFVTALTRRLVALGHPPETARAEARARRRALFAGRRDREEALADGRILLVNDRPTPEGGAVSIATDITNLKATERTLAQRAAAIDAAQDGIAITDEDGRFVYMNPTHLAMFGYTREAEVLGRHWSVLYPTRQAEMVERVGVPEFGRCGTWRTEITGLSRTGAPVEQEISLSLLPGLGIICVTRDASERHRTEREHARLRDQLQAAQRQEAIGQLAAGVAHDFNNLLSAIGASADMARSMLAPGHGAVAHLDRVSGATRSAARLVRQLLSLGGRERRAVRLDLGEVLHEAADLLRAGVPARIAIGLDPPGSPVTLEADPTDLRKIVCPSAAGL